MVAQQHLISEGSFSKTLFVDGIRPKEEVKVEGCRPAITVANPAGIV
jgi:hypothetical protein